MRDGQKPAVINEQGPELSKTVQKLMFEQMVFAESKSLDFEGVSESELATQWQKLKKNAIELSSIQKAYSVSESDLKKRLEKTLWSEKFLKKKIDTLTPIITDAEIQRYIKSNPDRFKNKSFEELKPSIEAVLKNERTDKGLQDWIRFLTQKYGASSEL